jgi:hypothetical protein
MSVRLNCRVCRTAFLTADDHLGRTVACPKCGAEQSVPTTVPAAMAPQPSAAEATVWVPRDEAEAHDHSPRKARKTTAIALLATLPLMVLAVLVAGPLWSGRNRPVSSAKRPLEPTERIAAEYLDALVRGDDEVAHRLGTVEEPPAIRSYQLPRLDRDRTKTVKGSFAPIAALHAQIAKDFQYDPDLGRFQVRNPLGPAAETLDVLHAAKANGNAIAQKIESGNPDDLFDAAEALAQPFAKLAETILSPQRLVPTYEQLVKAAKPPLPPAEQSLALDYAAHRPSWDALLKRPFLTLKADGPFLLDRAEVVALVRDKLAARSDPPTRLRLTLTRFRLEGIDTGWKVTSARREPAETSPPSYP